MKILDIIVTEDFEFDGNPTMSEPKSFSAGAMSVSDLNSLQIRTLKRLSTGAVDIETASNKEVDLIMELIELGLVDNDGELTPSGQEAIEVPSTNVDIAPAIAGDNEIDDVGGVPDFENDDDDDMSDIGIIGFKQVPN